MRSSEDKIKRLEETIYRLQVEKYQQQLKYSREKARLQRQIDKHNSWILQRFPHDISVMAVQESDPVYLAETEAVSKYIDKLEKALDAAVPDWRKK